MRHRLISILLGVGAVAVWACADNSVTAAHVQPGQGTLAVQLVDDPTALDSIASVNIFVVRVDARVKVADSVAADSSVDGDGDFDDRGRDFGHDHRDSTAWVTIASPNKLINILDLQHGDTAILDSAVLDTIRFRSMRIIIDPSQSNVTLKDGTVLTATSTPPVDFFSRGRFGVLVDLDNDVDVKPGAMTTITLDFRLGESIALRGHSIGHDGLVIRAVVQGHCH
ncbi:MAG TPA: DUF4382 domain-containing protein [Gemmatimonadaceae bacterium]|nr:DUF4382 domain-containing protein [Gemmatimonadaceae bacterium]